MLFDHLDMGIAAGAIAGNGVLWRRDDKLNIRTECTPDGLGGRRAVIGTDLPLSFHPVATGAQLVFTPFGVG